MSRITLLAWLPGAGGCRLCSAFLGREEAGKPPLRPLCRQLSGNALLALLVPVARSAAGTGCSSVCSAGEELRGQRRGFSLVEWPFCGFLWLVQFSDGGVKSTWCVLCARGPRCAAFPLWV